MEAAAAGSLYDERGAPHKPAATVSRFLLWLQFLMALCDELFIIKKLTALNVEHEERKWIWNTDGILLNKLIFMGQRVKLLTTPSFEHAVRDFLICERIFTIRLYMVLLEIYT